MHYALIIRDQKLTTHFHFLFTLLPALSAHCPIKQRNVINAHGYIAQLELITITEHYTIVLRTATLNRDKRGR